MRYAIFFDVHSKPHASQAVLTSCQKESIKHLSPDSMVCLRDIAPVEDSGSVTIVQGILEEPDKFEICFAGHTRSHGIYGRVLDGAISDAGRGVADIEPGKKYIVNVVSAGQ